METHNANLHDSIEIRSGKYGTGLFATVEIPEETTILYMAKSDMITAEKAIDAVF